MSLAVTLARPYAAAVFSVARQNDQLQQWSDALSQSALIAADPFIASLMKDPRLTSDQVIALVKPEPTERGYLRFLQVTHEAGRLILLPEIAQLFEHMRARLAHIVQAKIISATPLSPNDLDKMVASLTAHYGAKVQATTAVDPSLIGGAVIIVDDVVIDGSLKGKLSHLQGQLQH